MEKESIRYYLERGDRSGVRLIVENKVTKKIGKKIRRMRLPTSGNIMDKVGEDNIPTLNWAAFLGDAHLVALLLSHGYDVNNQEEEKSNRTALHECAYYGHVDVAKVLLQHGAVVNAVTNSEPFYQHHQRGNETAMQIAAARGHVEMVKVLIRHGADVNAVDHDKCIVWFFIFLLYM